MRTCLYDLVIFDWDGTIMDTVPLIVESLQVAAQKLGLPVPTESYARTLIGLAQTETKIALFGDAAVDWDAYENAYRTHYIERERSLDVFPGMKELLNEIKGAGAKLALATGKSDHGIQRVFKRTGLGSLFDSVETASNGISKPDSGIILTQCHRLGIAPWRTVMVGDSHLDLTMAKNAQVHAIGVTYGAQTREQLCQVGYGRLAEDMETLSSLLFQRRTI